MQKNKIKFHATSLVFFALFMLTMSYAAVPLYKLFCQVLLYLHEIKKELDLILTRENRYHLLSPIFKFLPTRVKLDLLGWDNIDIFSHS